MKMSVSAWTTVEEDLPKVDGVDPLGASLLVAEISRRTFGRRWSDEIAIAVPKPLTKAVLTIMSENNLRQVWTEKHVCTHKEGTASDPYVYDKWSCPMCDGKGFRTVVMRVVPKLPDES